MGEESVREDYEPVGEDYLPVCDEAVSPPEPARIGVEDYQFFPGASVLVSRLPFAGYVFTHRGRWYISHIPGHPVYRVEFSSRRVPEEYSYIEVIGYGYRYVRIAGNRFEKILVIHSWRKSSPPPVNIEEIVGFDEYLDNLLNGVELSSSRMSLLLAYTVLGSPLIDSAGVHVMGGGRLLALGRHSERFTRILGYLWGGLPRPYRLLVGKTYRDLLVRRRPMHLEKNAVKPAKTTRIHGSQAEAPISIVRSALRSRWELMDSYKYVLAKKIIYPVSFEENLLDAASEIARRIVRDLERINPPQEVYGRGRLIDPNYTGSPLAVIRVAMGIARSRDETRIRREYLETAYQLIIDSINTLLSEIPRRPGLIPYSEKIRALIRIIEEDTCIGRKQLEEQAMKIMTRKEYQKTMDILLRSGRIYMPDPQTICIT